MAFDLINKMKVDELKKYLRLRGLKVSGRKAKLVAKVFSDAENDVKPICTAEEVDELLQDEYFSKLIVDDIDVPDPYEVKEGWLNEDGGQIHDTSCIGHPMTYGSIFIFIMIHPSYLGGENLSDYKTTKAYSDFANGWLGKISILFLDSALCVMKADCRPSERVNDPDHKVWICLTKKEGTIKAAYCSCMAGMSETCNHVAALLFRIEVAVTCGLTTPSCTEKASGWLPNRKEVKSMQVKDMILSRYNMKKNKGTTRK